MLGGTSTPSGQRFDRGAIIAVLDLVTEYIYHNMDANSPFMEREKGPSMGTVQSSKEQLGVENACLQAEGCAA